MWKPLSVGLCVIIHVYNQGGGPNTLSPTLPGPVSPKTNGHSVFWEARKGTIIWLKGMRKRIWGVNFKPAHMFSVVYSSLPFDVVLGISKNPGFSGIYRKSQFMSNNFIIVSLCSHGLFLKISYFSPLKTLMTSLVCHCLLSHSICAFVIYIFTF